MSSYPKHLTSGEAFVVWDRLLDRTRSEPVYLAQPDIARLVVHQLREVVRRGLCIPHAYVVMPNHIHVLWTPYISLADLVRRVKGPIACQANRHLRRTGEPFLQQEYFDRTVREEKEFLASVDILSGIR